MFIAALVVPVPLGVLLAFVALAGLGTSGTQILLFGFVANYYRTNVRAAGVAWCAGFGRLGGVGGPLVGGILIGAGLGVTQIFLLLAGVAVVGLAFVLLVPPPARAVDRRRGSSVDTRRGPERSGGSSVTMDADMYDRILVAIDATPTEDNLALWRAAVFARRWGSKVYLLHVSRGHILPADITGSAGLGVTSQGVVSAEDDVELTERDVVQQAVDILSAAGSRPSASG